MENQKYTYDDWWKGRVHLQTCPALFPKGIQLPAIITLDDFTEADVPKIKKKQKELYAKCCTSLLEKFQVEFKTSYEQSAVKEVYLANEIADLNKILVDGDIDPRTKLLSNFSNRDFSIEEYDLQDMRRFYQVFFVRGKKYFDFIHSPNFKYQDRNKIPSEIYISVCFKHLKWVNDNYHLSEEDRLPVPVIALIHYYNGIVISRDIADGIASKHGYNAKKSGEGLYQDYNFYADKDNRRIVYDDKSKASNKKRVKRMELVIKHLKGEAKKSAEKDIKTLNEAISKHEW